MRHKHADVIIALANDTSLKVEFRYLMEGGEVSPWQTLIINEYGFLPLFRYSHEYRIKKEPEIEEFRILYKFLTDSQCEITENYYKDESEFSMMMESTLVEFVRVIPETRRIRKIRK